MTTQAADIDVDALGALLVKIEQRHEREGWHNDANFWAYVAYENGSEAAEPLEQIMSTIGKPVRTARYSAQPMIPPRLINAAAMTLGEEKPSTAFCRYAANLAYGNPDLMPADTRRGMIAYRDVLRSPGVTGFAVCYEAFANSDQSKVASLFAGALGHLGDVLSSYEMRGAQMVDRNDQTHIVDRKAGECAELHLSTVMLGDVTSALRMLMDAAAARLVTTQEEFESRYPTTWSAAKEQGLIDD